MIVEALEQLEEISGPDHKIALEVARGLGEVYTALGSRVQKDAGPRPRLHA
jgi:hypothetical protein